MSEAPAGARADPGRRVRGVLETLGQPYELLACDPELADTEVFCAHYGVDPADSANTLLVASKSGQERRLAACVLLASTKLDVNRTVRKRLGVRRISFASAEQTRGLTGMVIGGVTPVGLPETVPVWVDARVMARERIVLGGGDRNTKLAVAPSVLTRLPGVEIVEGLALER